MGYNWYENLVHIPYGLVSLEGEKLSTRTGNIIYAEDILHEAINRAKELIDVKNSLLEDKDNVAKQVGIGAVIFHDLFNQRIKNIDFSWSDVLSFEGTTGPYVQYTYARAGSILRKYGQEIEDSNIEYLAFTDDVTYELIKTLSGYEKAIETAAARYEPSVIARYLISLSTAFNKFYQECAILKEENEGTKIARLYLVGIVKEIIVEGCGLLGIQCPEKM